ncbi:histidine--tRNA ligase [Candidatus Dojkabacteria bacterium]|nr:histidine--tRNA ligase [Candidatus Dojkabacteria bacterium]
MNKNLIQARTLKGFRDFLADELNMRRKIFGIFEDIFEKYGYEPLETSNLEYYDILTGKYGEEEKLIYNFTDFGGRRVGMRYDLTVPTARVYAQYKDKLPLPWKRYAIQKVWRADNTQKGRYREFYQMDADSIGVASMISDTEFIDMGIEIIQQLGFQDFEVQINNRKILNAVAKYAGREDKFEDIVYAVDKWEKRPEKETREDLLNRGLRAKEVDKIFECIELEVDGNYEQLDNLQEKFFNIPEGLEGIKELKEIFNLLQQKDFLKYKPTISRGLVYYTGPVWEWVILEGGVGSIGGCGRYDKLIGSMLGEDIPATGGSFGVERIIEVMKDRNMLLKEDKKEDLLVTIFNEEYIQKSYGIATEIRRQGLTVILYPDIKPLKKQLEFADKKSIDWVVIIGEEEEKENVVTVRNMKSGEQRKVKVGQVKDLVQN